MLEKDIADNMAIGKYGADEILSDIPDGYSIRILTHCNTGSLATAGYSINTIYLILFYDIN